MDLVESITPVGFKAKRYFFMFIDDNIYITETYTRKLKSKWLKNLKVFYNLVCIRTGLDKPIKRLQSDYGSELQS